MRGDLEGASSCFHGGVEPYQTFAVVGDVEGGNLPGDSQQVVGKGPDIGEARGVASLRLVG